jgi:hypothetical protein
MHVASTDSKTNEDTPIAIFVDLFLRQDKGTESEEYVTFAVLGTAFMLLTSSRRSESREDVGSSDETVICGCDETACCEHILFENGYR